jgi:hypothetical protein
VEHPCFNNLIETPPALNSQLIRCGRIIGGKTLDPAKSNCLAGRPAPPVFHARTPLPRSVNFL